MPNINLISLFAIFVITLTAYLACKKIMRAQAKTEKIASLPHHYGLYGAFLFLLPGLATFIAFAISGDKIIAKLMQNHWQTLMNDYGLANPVLAQQKLASYLNNPNINLDIKESLINAAENYIHWRTIINSAYLGILACLPIAVIPLVKKHLNANFPARRKVELYITLMFAAASLVAVLTTLGIVLSLIFESLRFFQEVPITEFLFGLHWSPQIAIRENQVGATGAFGAIPLFAGTFLISAIAMVVAIPLGLLSAIYLSQYASLRFRRTVKPMLEMLAGIPTVVYGFFAAITVAPLIKKYGETIGLTVAFESALAAGAVMGIMILPFVSSLSDDVISAVPQNMRDGAYALGSTQSETVIKILIPAALPGIAGAFILAVSRAIGETMIVVMASGLVANLTANPLQAVTTVTTQIATLLVGDQEFNNPKTLAAFALGLALFLVTMGLNLLAMTIVKKYREQYE